MAKYNRGNYSEIDENLIYSSDTYYEIMQKISTVGIFYALYPEAKIKIKQNQKFFSDFCPVHCNTPGKLAFLINENDLYWYCYGCRMGGMTVDLLINNYSLYGLKQDKAIEILSWLCEVPLTSILDDEQVKIYNEIRTNYSYTNSYKKDSDEYTKLITDRFKAYLNKYGWSKKIYDKASVRYDGLRSVEIDTYFNNIESEERQKLYKRKNRAGEDLPF